MTKPKQAKTPEQLANEHWNFLEGLILENMRLTMRLFIEGFKHGYKHGKEDTENGVRPKQRKE